MDGHYFKTANSLRLPPRLRGCPATSVGEADGDRQVILIHPKSGGGGPFRFKINGWIESVPRAVLRPISRAEWDAMFAEGRHE
jgi:hypothetical protein